MQLNKTFKPLTSLHDRADDLRSVEMLMASVAHEIRNPLTYIKVWVHSLRQSAAQDSELGRKCRIAAQELARLEKIVQSFLEFAKLPELDLHPSQVGSVLDKALEIMGPRLEGVSVSVARPRRGELPPAMADEDQLRQVFINLLSNAVEAVESGGEIRISTSVEIAKKGRRLVVVRISDTGPGMPREVRDKPFRPFVTTKPGGTGLGLCIAAAIMERHGGTLSIEPSDGGGTSIAVKIPVARPEPHAQDPRSGRRPRSPRGL